MFTHIVLVCVCVCVGFYKDLSVLSTAYFVFILLFHSFIHSFIVSLASNAYAYTDSVFEVGD